LAKNQALLVFDGLHLAFAKNRKCLIVRGLSSLAGNYWITATHLRLFPLCTPCCVFISDSDLVVCDLLIFKVGSKN